MLQNRIFLTLLIVGGYLGSHSVLSVSLGRLNKLKREEYIQLDRDGAEAYDTSFDQLDNTNVTYDDELFKLLRAYRNSITFQLHDFTYSNELVMHRSQGAKVDRKLCHKQLETLLTLSRVAHEQGPENYGLAGNRSIPFSAISFLETFGSTESGLLDGNSVWLGSYSGCIRAKIPAKSAQLFRPDLTTEGSDINGRYCIAHLKAKAWPKWDIYFENRISIKVGLCLPESCHSLHYAQNETIRSNVDHLARSHLLEPFNSQRYYIDQLYCMPDEDSPFRQLNLGAKIFLAFCLGWAMVLIYANIEYGIRMRKLRKLLEAPEMVNGNDSRRGAIGPDGTPGQGKTNLDLVKAFSIISNLEILCEANISGVKDEQRKRLLAEPDRPTRDESVRANEQSMSLVTLDKALNLNQSRDGMIQMNSSAPNQPQVARIQEVKGRRINLNIVYGIKAICIFAVVSGHSFMISFSLYKNLKDLDLKTFDVTYMACLNSLHSVNLFYIMTGILISYSAFRKQQITQPAYWILVIVRRYFRLIPAYMLVFCFAKYLATYTGSGPLWPDYRTDVENPRSFCSSESWLSMLTLTTKYDRISDGCLPHAWYLTVDFKLVLIIPFYIILLSRNKFLGYVAIFLTFIGCLWRQVSLLQSSNVDWSQAGLHNKAHSVSLLTIRSYYFYIDLFSRLATCLFGVACGHLIYLYETRQISDWPRWFRKFGLKISFCQIPSNWVTFMIVALKASVEIYFCIILILLMTGGGFKTLNKLLTSRLAKILSILSYGVFLVHVELMFKFPAYRGDYYYLFLASFALLFNFVSNLLSMLILILYQMPINHVMRNYLDRAAEAVATTNSKSS